MGLLLWAMLALDLSLIVGLIVREGVEAWRGWRQRQWLAKHGRTLLEFNAALKACYRSPFAELATSSDATRE